MEFDLGPVADLPENRCQAVADGSVVAFRVGDSVRAFSSRCLHQNSSLDGGWIRDGVLSCPLHFWRYDITDGRLLGSSQPAGLQHYPVTVTNGNAVVELPDPAPSRSFREQQLAHAAEWNAKKAAEQKEHTDE